MASQLTQKLRNSLGLIAAASAGIYLAAIPLGALSVDRRFGTVEIALFATVILYCSPIPDRLLDFTFGKEGLTARFHALAQRQEEQASEIRVLQVLLKGIVNEFQLEKLRGIDGDEPFMVRYHSDMFFEIKDLDAKRFVQPRPGYGVNSIHDHVHDPGEFDLKKYFRITNAGREYLEVRDALVKEQERETTGN